MSKPFQKSRRDFLKQSTLATGIALTGLAVPRVHAAESGPLKIGLLGCGGRGCGAVVDGLTHDPNVKLVAVADIFPEKAAGAVTMLKKRFPDRIDVTEETTFSGFDAYKSVIPLCDVVFNCTPQHFRPMTMRATIEAGKHAFCEKPVAVDATGIRSILETCKLAEEKKLNIVTGLIGRYNPQVRETVRRIHDGEIGEMITAKAIRLGGFLWMRPRTPEENEMLYQMKNWVNFNWLTSDYINDVTIHQLDIAMWCMGDDRTPVTAFGLGGRTARTMPDAGDMYDNISVAYEYEDGRPLYAFSRQIAGCYASATAQATGTKGFAEMTSRKQNHITPFGGEPVLIPKTDFKEAYFNQHTTLYNAIRGDAPYVNNLPYTAKATMVAIMGRMATYTGQRITWEEALNSTEDFTLKDYSWNATPPTLPDADGCYPIAMPGRKKD